MKEKQEEERRVYYVAMTRAKETLCLFERFDMPNPNTSLLEGDFVLKRDPSMDAPPDDLVLRRRYDILGMEDLFLDFAGYKAATDPVHKQLMELYPGDLLKILLRNDSIFLCDLQNNEIAKLSKRATDYWGSRLNFIEKVTVLAMVQRCSGDSGEEYRTRCQCERWEVPVVEIVYTSSSAENALR